MNTEHDLTQTEATRIRLEDALKVFDTLDVSETTRADYKARIGHFLKTTRKSGLTRNSFLDYKRSLADRTNIAISTKNKYLAAARVFLRELYRFGYLPVDVTVNVRSFDQSKRHKRLGITEEEMAQVVASVRDLPCTPDATRLRALLTLLGLQGLRQVEICRLDITDIDLVGMRAMVHGKGRDDKEAIDLHPETVRAIREYVETNKVADGPLFVGRSNNSRRLSTRGVRLIIGQLLKQLGIEKSVHGFRHYFTTRLVKTYAGDLLAVAQYTRHRSLEMLQIYDDSVRRQNDLPRFYRSFGGLKFGPEDPSASDNGNYRKQKI